MVFPNLAQKHTAEALFHPEDYIRQRLSKLKIPENVIIIYYDHVLRYFKRHYSYRKVKVNGLVTVYIHKNIAVMKVLGIGSPVAVTDMEELIALGAKRFLNLGSCGGLQDFGVFVCTKAIRDEGTSHHYVKSAKYAYPDKNLTAALRKAMANRGLSFEDGISWTIDAPYRETRKEIMHYKKEGVKTVEMEASALFSLGKYRKIPIAAAFVVSDVLHLDGWNPQFKAQHVRQNLHTLLDAGMDCLKKF